MWDAVVIANRHGRSTVNVSSRSVSTRLALVVDKTPELFVDFLRHIFAFLSRYFHVFRASMAAMCPYLPCKCSKLSTSLRVFSFGRHGHLARTPPSHYFALFGGNHKQSTPRPPLRPPISRALAVNLLTAFVLPRGLHEHDETLTVTVIQPEGPACGRLFDFVDRIVSASRYRENRGVGTGNSCTTGAAFRC